MSNPEEMLHIVVPCKGRLQFLQQTIPAAIAQPRTTYTLVDYTCPEKSGEWTRENFPSAHVIEVPGRTFWQAAEPRNIGARSTDGGWLCILDSDVIVSPDFSEVVLSLVRPGIYLIAPPEIIQLNGMLICSKADFDRCGGYDENMQGWGWEDNEMRAALDQLGLVRAVLPEGLLTHIDHDDTFRTKHCEIKKKFESAKISMAYSNVKAVLAANGGAGDRATLKRVYAYFKERHMAGYSWLPIEYRVTPEIHAQINRNLAAISRDFEFMEATAWGGVRAFHTEMLNREPILELLTIHDGQVVCVECPGRTAIAAMTLVGDPLTFPVKDGIARIPLTTDSIFLLDPAKLVRDVEIDIAAGDGPSLIVGLTPAEGLDAVVDVTVIIGERDPIRERIALSGETVRMRIPVATSSPETPEEVTVRVACRGLEQETVRRTVFLTAPRVTDAEAMSTVPPERIRLFAVGGPESASPDFPTDAEAVEAAVAWGWTDTDLVCWIARYRDDSGPVPEWGPNDNVDIIVQPQNLRAHSVEALLLTFGMKEGAPLVIVDASYSPGGSITRNDLLTIEETENRRQMVVRLPFELLEISPEAGVTLGLTFGCSDIDADGRERSLKWGPGIDYNEDRLRINEITLSCSTGD